MSSANPLRDDKPDASQASAPSNCSPAWRTEPPDKIGLWWIGWFTSKGKWCASKILVRQGQLDDFNWPDGFYAPSDAIVTTPPAMPENEKLSGRGPLSDDETKGDTRASLK